MHVEERRLEPGPPGPAHVEEPGAPGAAEILPPGGGEEVAPEGLDVDRQLPRCLAGVEQVGDTRITRHHPDRGRRVHQPALGRDPRDRDHADALVEHRPQGVDRELPGLVVGDHLDPHAGAPCCLQERDHVAGVLGARREDAVIRREGRGQRVERHVPRARRVLHQRDLVRCRTDQRRHRVVDGVRTRRHRIGSGVPADACFQLEMFDDRVDDDTRWERGARVVEVYHVATSGRVGPDAPNVDRCGVDQRAWTTTPA